MQKVYSDERDLVLSWAAEVEFCWITLLLTQQMPLFEEKDSQDLHQTIPTSIPMLPIICSIKWTFLHVVVVAILNIKHILSLVLFGLFKHPIIIKT